MNKNCSLSQEFNSNETSSSSDGGHAEMAFFTLLLFDWDDAVVKVQIIRADDPSRARHTAETVMLTMPGLAGYQLWQKGRLVMGTFPQNVPAVPRVRRSG
jgi:hypothetical protein